MEQNHTENDDAEYSIDLETAERLGGVNPNQTYRQSLYYDSETGELAFAESVHGIGDDSPYICSVTDIDDIAEVEAPEHIRTWWDYGPEEPREYLLKSIKRESGVNWQLRDILPHEGIVTFDEAAFGTSEWEEYHQENDIHDDDYDDFGVVKIRFNI